MAKIFGTDGIRGIANKFPITPEVMIKVGKALAQKLRNKNNEDSNFCFINNNFWQTDRDLHPLIVIGKDTRLSGYMIESALTAGLVSYGAYILLVGPLPTPAIAHLTKSLNANAGIVISASHNPAHHNGIKIFSSNGVKFNEFQENQIEQIIGSLDNLKSLDCEHINGNLIGKAFRVNDAKGRYIEFAKSTIDNISLRGLKIVLDCANGAAYEVAPLIFSELGAEVIPLNITPNGLNINLDCGATHPELISNYVKKYNADIGISLDGDADRVIFCDEEGNIIDGDFILGICALDLKKQNKLRNNTIVTTVMANTGFEIAMKNNGIDVVRTKVGDKYVIDEMLNNNYNFGGEQSGHIIFGDYSTTGDGIITALQLLKIMKNNNKKISELKHFMEKYPQILINISVKEKKDFSSIPDLLETVNKIENELSSEGRVLLRYSGTEMLARVMVEGKNFNKIKEYAEKIAAIIKKNQ